MKWRRTSSSSPLPLRLRPVMATQRARHPSPPVLLLAPFHVLTFESLEIPKIRWCKKPHQRWQLLHPRRLDFLLPPDSNNHLAAHRLRHIGNQLALALLHFPCSLSKPPAPQPQHVDMLPLPSPYNHKKKWESFLFYFLTFSWWIFFKLI